MAILFTEVMNMNNRDKTFLQKIKDNAFYLSLGLGLFAILAVVGVYTAQQKDLKVAENQMDLNVASNYSDITEEDELILETNGEVAEEEETTVNLSEHTVDVAADTEKESSAEGVSKEESTQNDTENSTETDEAEEKGTSDTVPTSVDAGQLDFNSEKTITWPVNGEVILPYSMETTVYFKTLEQYQCNPGMLIKAGTGTTVQNAYLGKVTSVTSDDTYGNMVTLYIGNDYSIVYGQLDMIYVKEGDFVKAGQSIGTVGNPTDCFTSEGSHLFFQMKCGEEVVDPMLYIE